MLEEEEYETDYDDGDDREYERRRAAEKKKEKEKRRTTSRAVTIVALLAGAAVLTGRRRIFIVKIRAFLTKQKSRDRCSRLIIKMKAWLRSGFGRKTEEEAKALVEAVNLGKQMVGEEASDQEKEESLPRIFSRNKG